jgi:diphthamide biosynthesis protein 7
MFAAGSYDEYVRLYDSRMLHRPLWNVYVGGGVWRIKWHPMFGKDDDGKYDKILVAAMHGGCRVVNCTGLGARDSGRNESINAEVVSSFTAHKSMAYGADWIWFDGQPDTLEAASSCSFYDRQVFMWCHEKFQIK